VKYLCRERSQIIPFLPNYIIFLLPKKYLSKCSISTIFNKLLCKLYNTPLFAKSQSSMCSSSIAAIYEPEVRWIETSDAGGAVDQLTVVAASFSSPTIQRWWNLIKEIDDKLKYGFSVKESFRKHIWTIRKDICASIYYKRHNFMLYYIKTQGMKSQKSWRHKRKIIFLWFDKSNSHPRKK